MGDYIYICMYNSVTWLTTLWTFLQSIISETILWSIWVKQKILVALPELKQVVSTNMSASLRELKRCLHNQMCHFSFTDSLSLEKNLRHFPHRRDSLFLSFCDPHTTKWHSTRWTVFREIMGNVCKWLLKIHTTWYFKCILCNIWCYVNTNALLEMKCSV